MVTVLKKYERQMVLPEIGLRGQQRLGDSSVLVVGAGGLGCPLLLYLAGAGIGKIGIVDGDQLEESNLHRQVLYAMADIGQNKAETAARKLTLLNPEVDITPYPVRLTAENASSLFTGYDLVIDGSDNFPTRYLVNDICVTLKKPLVFGSIFQFEGQVSVFNFKGGPDYRALYPEPPSSAEVPNCGESGVIGPLPGIIGSIMANEALKIICGFGEPLSGQLLVFNALNNETQLFKFGNTSAKQLQQDSDRPLPYVVPEIDSHILAEWQANHIQHILIDLREAYEYEEYNIGGTNIPLYELNTHIDELLQAPRIVFCCTASRRSKIAVNLLKNNFQGDMFTLMIPVKLS